VIILGIPKASFHFKQFALPHLLEIICLHAVVYTRIQYGTDMWRFLLSSLTTDIHQLDAAIGLGD
jgi:hypothetical protein